MEYKARLRGLWRIISSKTIISVMVIVVTVGCSTHWENCYDFAAKTHRRDAGRAENFKDEMYAQRSMMRWSDALASSSANAAPLR